MAFKMKGFPMHEGKEHGKPPEAVASSGKRQLGDRWEGMTIEEFDANLKEARADLINSEPKPTAAEVKEFDKTHAANRKKALGY